MKLRISFLLLLIIGFLSQAQTRAVQMGNPVITDKYTGDPAALVYKDSVYLYAGHDEAPNDFNFYKMDEWLVYSSADMKTWKSHKVPLKVTDFKWAKGDAWAAQVTEKNGKFYWYVCTTHATIPGKAIGIAVSDSPLGPFKDALGKALITNDMTKQVDIDWDDIDPTVFTDADGQTYLYWGNRVCKYVRLKKNMTEIDGDIHVVDVPNFTEAPWLHKKKDWYYLSYAYEFPEKIAYAMSKSPTGPWEFKGILNELAGNCNTNHQSIIEFKGKDYFIYHNGATQPHGGSFRRSVCIDKLEYNTDGTMKRVIMTTEGIK
ncbi:glycoside hydrolase family 43 protein [Flavobacterium silvaticum]|uniref:Family 43 glycosylhydrolase n=1 Tax=Flavobacterium silvaticum TaxID=1852020 RepID=A0A972JIS8_9FLAO|nr:glycoside hydrolase family 43 protein [Flavobacterium silvaticum]NMH28618.1 family 43 glycosylhydrolase [Flavobacterium silvaticum]